MEREIKVGTAVITDARHERGGCFEALVACEDWDAAEYRLPGVSADGYALPALAVNVEVTGRKVRYDAPKLRGTPVVRVAVTFVNEDEENVTVGGWADANTMEVA